MITLKSNANELISKQMKSNGVRAFYLSVCERYEKGYVQCFITDLQSLITKVGILVSLADRSGPSISYCPQSIEYLCKKVLGSSKLYDTFDSLGVNEKGNIGKHTISTNSIDMDRVVTTYNSMVDTIARNYGLSALKTLIVRKRKSKTAPASNENKQKPKPRPAPAIRPAPEQTEPSESSTIDDRPVHKKQYMDTSWVYTALNLAYGETGDEALLNPSVIDESDEGYLQISIYSNNFFAFNTFREYVTNAKPNDWGVRTRLRGDHYDLEIWKS